MVDSPRRERIPSAFSRGETQRQRFTKLWRYMGYGSDLGRIIIPLWGCSAQWHDKDLHLDGDERQKDFFFDCTTDISDPQTLKIHFVKAI